jgi:AraC-like DNA-binding protein
VRQMLSQHGQPRPAKVTAAAFDYAIGTTVRTHKHEEHQLVYAAKGVMRVRGGKGIWVLPPSRALLVPAGTNHEIYMTSNVQMRTLYLERETYALACPRSCVVVPAGLLLRELILRLIGVQKNSTGSARERHLCAVIIDEMHQVEARPLRVPLPDEPVLRRMCQALEADPACPLTAAQWGSKYGLSAKTLERAFLRELHMTFGQWRQQMRLLAALERLASGETIASVAAALGYRGVSAFTAMFRRALGTTPSRYFEAQSG